MCRGKFDEAAAVLQRAIDSGPNNATAHYVMSEVLAKKSKFEDAYREALLATQLDPKETQAFCALAEASLGRGDLATGISAYKKLCELDATNDDTHHKLAMVLGLSGDFEGQIKEEKAALDIEPNNDDAQIGLASALSKKGDKGSALAVLKKLLKNEPNSVEARAFLERIQSSPNAK